MLTAAVPLDGKDKVNTFGWMQIDKASLAGFEKLALQSPIALAVLLWMAQRMTRTNGLVVGQKTIAESIGKTERSVCTAFALLDKLNFIERIKVGTGFAYRVNSRVFWQGRRGERYAHFYAHVIAIESEQSSSIDGRTPLKTVPHLQKIVGDNEETT